MRGLPKQCRSLGAEIRHPEHKQFSVAEMLEHERAHLMPMPEAFDGYIEKPARVPEHLSGCGSAQPLLGAVRAGRSDGSRTGLYPAGVAVVADDKVVGRHERLGSEGQTRYDWQHYIPLLQRKPGALRNGAPFTDQPAPQNAATTLQVATPPLANTARYDSLRADSTEEAEHDA